MKFGRRIFVRCRTMMKIDHQRGLRVGPLAHLDPSSIADNGFTPVCGDGELGFPTSPVSHLDKSPFVTQAD